MNIKGISDLKRVTRVLTIICVMFLGHKVSAQNEAPAPEKVIFQTNKSIYLVGDSIYFKAYIFDYESYNLSETSKILYVDLFYEGKSIISQKLRIENGVSTGVIQIPSSIGTGELLLVGHTNWMLNFPNLSYSQHWLNVHNPKFPNQDFKDSKKDKFTFYPEGGNLISGQLNLVSFYSKDSEYYGKEANIINSQTEKVATLKIDSLGYGNFSILPKEDAPYSIAFEKDTLSVSFPMINPQAASFKIVKNDDGVLVLINFGSQFKSDTVELLLQSKGLILSKQKIAYTGYRRAKFEFSYEKMETGLNQFVLLNESGEKLTERLIFVNLDKTDNTLSVQGLEESIKTNSFIDLKIKSDKDFHSTILIQESDDYPAKNVFDLSLQKELFSEIGTTVLSYEILNKIKSDTIWLDKFLITKSLKTFKFENKNDGDVQFFQPEFSNEFTLKGGIKIISSGEPLANTSMLCIVIGEKKLIYHFKTDENGTFRIPVESFEGNSKVIFKNIEEPFYDRIDKFKVSLNEPKLDRFVENDLLNIRRDEKYDNYSKIAVKRKTIESIYCGVKSVIKTNSSSVFNESFFSDYTNELNYKNYILLNDFREIIKELFFSIKIIKGKHRENEIRLMTYSEPGGEYLDKMFDESPLILLDGIPIDDHDIIINLDPRDIEFIRTINTEVLLNDISFSGLLEINTKKKLILNRDLAGQYKMDYTGFSPSISKSNFTNCGEKQLSNKNFPDFRNQLFWDSKIDLLNEVIHYKAPNNAGRYEIIVDMVSQDGEISQYHQNFILNED